MDSSLDLVPGRLQAAHCSWGVLEEGQSRMGKGRGCVCGCVCVCVCVCVCEPTHRVVCVVGRMSLADCSQLVVSHLPSLAFTLTLTLFLRPYLTSSRFSRRKNNRSFVDTDISRLTQKIIMMMTIIENVCVSVCVCVCVC